MVFEAAAFAHPYFMGCGHIHSGQGHEFIDDRPLGFESVHASFRAGQINEETSDNGKNEMSHIT